MFSRRRRSGLGRGFALALASCVVSCVVAAQLSSFAHLLLVRHALCPEHGELIHASERPTLHTRSEQGLATAALARESGAQSALDHQHCPLALQSRERVALLAHAASVFLPLASPQLALRSQLLPDASMRELFRLAPKGSPPAA
jgi:hypothetical protein